MTVASGRRPGPGALVPQQQGDGLELRAHGRRHAAALGDRLDLTGVSGEHRHDVVVVVVADASLIPRGGTASARLALAWSSQRLLLCVAEARGPRHYAVRSRGRDEERPEHRAWCSERRADMRISVGSTQRVSTSVTRGPGTADWWVGDHSAGKASSDDRSGSRLPFILTLATAHNSRPRAFAVRVCAEA